MLLSLRFSPISYIIFDHARFSCYAPGKYFLYTVYPLGQFCMLFCCLFFLNQLFQKVLLGLPSVSNSLDPDQARHFVGPDLDPNCLQRLSAYNVSR